MATWRNPLPLLAVASFLIVSASSEILKLKSNPFGNFAIGFEKGFINSGKYSVIVPEGDVERRRTVMIRGPGVRDSVDMVFNSHVMVFSDWSGLFMLGGKVYSDTFGTLYYIRADHKCSKKVYQNQSGAIVVVDSETLDKDKCDAIRAKVESALHNYLEEPYKFLRPQAPPELRASPGFPGGDYVTGVTYGKFTCGQHNVELPAGDCDKERKVKISGPGVQDEIKLKVDMHSKLYGSWDGHFYLADKVFSVEPQTLVVEKDDGSCIKKFYGTEGPDTVVAHQILMKQEDCFVIKSGVFADLQKHIEPSSLSLDDKKELEDLEKKNKQSQSGQQSGKVQNGGIPIQVSSTVVMPKRYQYRPVSLRLRNGLTHSIQHPVFRSLYEHNPQLLKSQDDGIVNIQTNDIDSDDAESVKNIQTNDVYVPASAVHDGKSPFIGKPDNLVKSEPVLYNDVESEEDSEEGEYYYVPVDAIQDTDEEIFLSPDELQQLSGSGENLIGNDFQMRDESKFAKFQTNNIDMDGNRGQYLSYKSDYSPIESRQGPSNTLLAPQGLDNSAKNPDFQRNNLVTSQQSLFPKEQSFEMSEPSQSVNPGQQMMVPEGLNRVSRSVANELRLGEVQNIQTNHVDLDGSADVTNLQTNDVESEDKIIRFARAIHGDDLVVNGPSNYEVYSTAPERLQKQAETSEQGKVVNIQTNNVEAGSRVTNIQTNKVEEDDLVTEEQFHDIDPFQESVHPDTKERINSGIDGGVEGGNTRNKGKRSIYLRPTSTHLPLYKLEYRPNLVRQKYYHPHSQGVQNVQTNKIDVDEGEDVSNIQTNVVNEHEDIHKIGGRRKRSTYLMYSPFEVQRHRQVSDDDDYIHVEKISTSRDSEVKNVQQNHVNLDEQETVRNIQTNDVNEHAIGRKKRSVYNLPSSKFGAVQNIQANDVDVYGQESVKNIQTNHVHEHALDRKKRAVYRLPSNNIGEITNVQTNDVDVDEQESVKNIQTNDVHEHALDRKKRAVYRLPSNNIGEITNFQTNDVDVDEQESVKNIQTNDVHEHALDRKKRAVYRLPSNNFGEITNVQTNDVDVDEQESVKNIQTNNVHEHAVGRKKRKVYLLPSSYKIQMGRQVPGVVENVQTNKVDVDGEERVDNIQTNEINEKSELPQSHPNFHPLLKPQQTGDVKIIDTDFGEEDTRSVKPYFVGKNLGSYDSMINQIVSDAINRARVSTEGSSRVARSAHGYTQPEVLNNQITNIDASKGLPGPDQPSEFISVQGNNILDPEDVKATQVTTVSLPENDGSPQTKPNPMYINTKILLNQGDGNDVPLYVRTPRGQGYIVDRHGRVLHIPKGPFRGPVKFIRLKKIHGHDLSKKHKLMMSNGLSEKLSIGQSSGVFQEFGNNRKERLGHGKREGYSGISNFKKDSSLQVNVDGVDGSMVVNKLLDKESLDTSRSGKNVILDVTKQLNKSLGKDKPKDSSGHIPITFMKDLKELKDIYNPDKLIVNIAQNTNFEKVRK